MKKEHSTTDDQEMAEVHRKLQELHQDDGPKLKDHLDVFDDAVIAIIITVMVLEVPLPDQTVGSYKLFMRAILIFLISFFMVANFWYENHQTFAILPRADKKFLLMNFAFLAALSLLPLLTKWLMQQPTNLAVANMGLDYLVINMLRRLMVNHTNRELFGKTGAARAFFDQITRWRIIGGFLLNIALIGVAFIQPAVAMIFYLALPIISFVFPSDRVK
ncbi:TMEM175 family protein [Lapidilactobacillus salsurivasis]